MKKYKVYWDPGMDTDAKAKVKVFTTGSPKEAYKKFLASEPKIKARKVRVDCGLFGTNLFRDHIREPSAEEKRKAEEEQEGTTEEHKGSSSLEQKLDKLYDVLNHIRWIGLSIGGMFALTFIIPQCTGN